MTRPVPTGRSTSCSPCSRSPTVRSRRTRSVDGTPVWAGLQLDEVAFPIVLAYQLGRTDAATWSHVKRAADFLIGFSQDGNRAPWSPQDRWENQSGYSPATIASEIAGLVCAAYIARVNGDAASARRYLATADDWQAQVKGWTVTTTGPYSAGPYFLRVTKDGNPNAGTTYDIGDSGPSNVDQRRVVDPSYLDLVRLGVLPANDPAVVNTLRVVDAQLGVRTDRGFFWHRASFDGYGEKANGGQWEFGLPNDSFITRGRAWPLLNGERGEYQIAAGDLDAARGQLTTMARAAGPGYMLPEQVWDQQPPAGTDGFVPGTPTFSATPLAWTHAQFIRLAWDARAGKVLEQPKIVAQRYGGSSRPRALNLPTWSGVAVRARRPRRPAARARRRIAWRRTSRRPRPEGASSARPPGRSNTAPMLGRTTRLPSSAGRGASVAAAPARRGRGARLRSERAAPAR